MPQLAILNACRTGLKPELRASRSRAALGLAEVLIRRGVPAVVSTQGDIHGEAAALLMGEFYAQLCSDKPAPIDLALAAARSRVAGSAKFGKKWDWGLPAIYLSASLQTAGGVEMPGMRRAIQAITEAGGQKAGGPVLPARSAGDL